MVDDTELVDYCDSLSSSHSLVDLDLNLHSAQTDCLDLPLFCDCTITIQLSSTCCHQGHEHVILSSVIRHHDSHDHRFIGDRNEYAQLNRGFKHGRYGYGRRIGLQDLSMCPQNEADVLIYATSATSSGTNGSR